MHTLDTKFSKETNYSKSKTHTHKTLTGNTPSKRVLSHKTLVCLPGTHTCQTQAFLLSHSLEDQSTCHTGHFGSIWLRFFHHTLSASEETCKGRIKLFLFHSYAAAVSAGSAATRSTLSPLGIFSGAVTTLRSSGPHMETIDCGCAPCACSHVQRGAQSVT